MPSPEDRRRRNEPSKSPVPSLSNLTVSGRDGYGLEFRHQRKFSLCP